MTGFAADNITIQKDSPANEPGHPTGRLRFINGSYGKTLQQGWINSDGSEEWRDVEIVDTESQSDGN